MRRRGRELLTVNADPGHAVYGEDLATIDGVELRSWDPFRSKLAAYHAKSAPADLFENVRSVLYLGGGHGTTVSHVADLLPDGRVFVVEKSPSALAQLLRVAERRTNLLPILADAQLPERYQADVGPVDLLYQDVAQRNQVGIFIENARAMLAPNGRGLLMLKVRSVTQTKPVPAVVRDAKGELSRAGFRVRGEADLAPFSRAHVALLVGR